MVADLTIVFTASERRVLGVLARLFNSVVVPDVLTEMVPALEAIAPSVATMDQMLAWVAECVRR